MEKENNFQMGFAAKKSLGQNFLHAPQVISAMVHAADIQKDSIILEVGPGKGALTSKLLQTEAKIIAVEKDDRAILFLKEKFRQEIENKKLRLIHGDILEIEPSHLGLENEKYSIVANIPYYISGEFLRKFLSGQNQPAKIVVMLQKELAKRIVDEKGSLLSLSVRVYGNPKVLMTVPKKFFRPIPKVDSAVLLIDKISKKFFFDNKIDENFFFEVLKAGFAHKRKVVIKNLSEKIDKETLKNGWENENWDEKIRAEELSLANWKKIVRFPQKPEEKS